MSRQQVSSTEELSRGVAQSVDIELADAKDSIEGALKMMGVDLRTKSPQDESDEAKLREARQLIKDVRRNSYQRGFVDDE